MKRMEAKEASEGEFAESEGVKVKKKMRNYRSNFFRSDSDQVQFLRNNCANYAAIARSTRIQSRFFFSFFFHPPLGGSLMRRR